MELQKYYKTFNVQKKYIDVNEQKILEAVYKVRTGTVEHAISYIINQAVLGHMDLNIDSTIMQMLSLNEYLSSLFVSNFKSLMYNYMIKYLAEERELELTEEILKKVEACHSLVTMKTELEVLLEELDQIG